MSGTARLVVVTTSPRVAPGQLTAAAWAALRSGAVRCADPDHPQLPALAHAGVAVEVTAEPQADGVWLAAPGADRGGLPDGADVVVGSVDLPGARLLDLVATMDRLRSPGGCPWDAEQTHASLSPYLLEESYEALDALETGEETGDWSALCGELGDVLLQVVFHARVAQERVGAGDGFDVDDVADAIVAKLRRRHPHVFAGASAADAAEVSARWEQIKDTEGRASVVAGVPLGQPALTLVATLLRRARRLGLPPALLAEEVAGGPVVSSAVVVTSAAQELEEEPETAGPAAVGRLLLAAVTLALAADIDPEAALRRRGRRLRDRLAALDVALRADGVDAAELDEVQWRRRWAAAVDEAADGLDHEARHHAG